MYYCTGLRLIMASGVEPVLGTMLPLDVMHICESTDYNAASQRIVTAKGFASAVVKFRAPRGHD